MTTIIAHRGASKLAPENTMVAFKLAYQHGAEGIETDVQLTKDNVPILMHDEKINRTTNGEGFIKDLTYKQLQQYDAGKWFHRKFEGSMVPTLETFLKWIKDKPLYLNIELKNNKIDYKHLESIVYEMVTHFKLQDHTILSSFNPNSIKRMKPFQKTMDIAFLTKKGSKNILDATKQLGASSLHMNHKYITENLVKQSHAKNLSVRAYTVNKANHMMTCFQTGCDGIFTDLPHKGMQYRELYHYYETFL
ncbi:glycerophosphodiester phosphodiesterase [Oceanobacillus halotolerans]|uniref:glycerophosphodiester phosphodiesterase n=1 Tax=Oceanobacillus halotolerans TaxID=2663380 RepID=UPI0013DD3772|nr:glycerophosphodiester phosphodiesterase [Oceanobacillus halotolerans]